MKGAGRWSRETVIDGSLVREDFGCDPRRQTILDGCLLARMVQAACMLAVFRLKCSVIEAGVITNLHSRGNMSGTNTQTDLYVINGLRAFTAEHHRSLVSLAAPRGRPIVMPGLLGRSGSDTLTTEQYSLQRPDIPIVS